MKKSLKFIGYLLIIFNATVLLSSCSKSNKYTLSNETLITPERIGELHNKYLDCYYNNQTKSLDSCNKNINSIVNFLSELEDTKGMLDQNEKELIIDRVHILLKCIELSKDNSNIFYDTLIAKKNDIVLTKSGYDANAIYEAVYTSSESYWNNKYPSSKGIKDRIVIAADAWGAIEGLIAGPAGSIIAGAAFSIAADATVNDVKEQN